LQLPAFLLTMDSIRSVRPAAVTTSGACALSVACREVGGDNPEAGVRRSPHGGAELDRLKLKRSVLLWIRRTLGGEVVRCLALVSHHPVRLPD
jgi:hypothetical protein